jgi:hypothetical protein
MRLRGIGGLAATCLVVVACSSTSAEDPPTGPAALDGSPGDAATKPNDGLDASAEAAGDAGSITLFNGVLGSDWRMTTIKNQPGRDDPGRFAVENESLVSHPGTDLGMLWNTLPTPADFLLELEWKLTAQDDNSGVLVRFPSPDSKAYDNTAFVAVDFGFEIQINEPGDPDGAPNHTTGAVYGEAGQAFTRVVAKPPGSWNAYEIRVEKQVYTVRLNGTQVTRFVNGGSRGVPSAPGAPSHIGLQTHSGSVAFRNIRIRSLAP